MNNIEFKNDFLLHFDRVAAGAAPGLDDYEISVFLTDGMHKLIKTHYDRLANRKRKGFEHTEKRRKDLSNLIESSLDTNSTSLTVVSSYQSGVHQNGVFYDMPTDFWLAVEESVLTSALRCDVSQPSDLYEPDVIDGKIVIEGDYFGNAIYTRIPVIPYAHDDYNMNIRNPFMKPISPSSDPDTATAWRLDFRRNSLTDPMRHEIITSGDYNIYQYYVRYLLKPPPIIVGDLTAMDDYTNESIDGITAVTQCVLDEMVHREIIAEAVSIALENIKDGRLQTQMITKQNIE